MRHRLLDTIDRLLGIDDGVDYTWNEVDPSSSGETIASLLDGLEDVCMRASIGMYDAELGLAFEQAEHLTGPDAADRWRERYEDVHPIETRYMLSRDFGTYYCNIWVVAAPEQAYDEATGQLREDGSGRRGEISFRGRLPDGYTPNQYRNAVFDEDG